MSLEMNNKEVLATVAGEEITREEFEMFLRAVPREQQAYLSNPQFREQCLQQFIALRLFAIEGKEMKLDETEEFKSMITNAKRDILAQMVMHDLISKLTVSEDEMKAFYEENKAQYQQGEKVHAKHILVDEEEKCKEILEQIENGTIAFETAAQEQSNCPSGSKGGDLGTFGKGQMVKEFEDAAFSAEIGKVTGPVKTQFGYHLIKVEEKHEPSATPFEEAKATIQRMLLQKKQNEAYAAKVQELREKYDQGVLR